MPASRWDGLTNYNVKAVETADEQEARLERFARELEEKGRQRQAEEQRQGQGQGQAEGQAGGEGDVDMAEQQQEAGVREG